MEPTREQMKAMEEALGLHPPSALDHIIFIVQEADIQQFADAGFTVVPGGSHADGQTANALIVIGDVYLELVYFVKKEDSHWWSQKQTGAIADFALTPTEASAAAKFVNLKRPDGSRIYKEPQEGGRKTREGIDLKWKVTFPDAPKSQRGRLPFLCEDITPRSQRVPAHRPHRNGATRITSLLILVAPGRWSEYATDLWLIIGQGLKGPDGSTISLDVREPSTEQERAWQRTNGEGVYQITVETSKQGIEDMPQGIKFKSV